MHANPPVPSRRSTNTPTMFKGFQTIAIPAIADDHEQHEALGECANPGARRLAEHDAEPGNRRRQQPLQLADVPLPDDAEPEEDRHEEGRLRHHAGNEKRAVVGVPPAQRLVVLQRGSEDEEPEERLD